MKKIYLFFVFVLAVLSVKAQVTFSVDDFKIKPGETKTMEFTMQATREVAAFDFYVRMPEGLEIVYPAKNRLTMSEWGSDLSGFADPKSDGSGDCHFTVYSQTGDPIAAGSGTIFQIDVKASEDVALGEASIYMYEFAIADGYGDEIMVDYTDLTSTMRFYEEYNLSATSSNEGWGSASMDPSGVVENGTEVTATASPAEGYEFVNWTKGDDVVSTDNPYTFTAVADLALVANFKAIKYDVTFDVDGVKTTESLDYGTVITKPEDPTKEGYTFAGWNPEFVEGTTVPVGGLTYNATWNVNYYTLTFKWNDVVYSTASVAYGSAITAPETPEREGYEFAGWTPEVPEVMPAEDLTFEATWDICYYEVSFVVDGEVVQSENLAYGSEIVAPEVAEKEGYTFVGWSPELLQYVPSYDVVFTAQFEVNVYTLTYYLDEEVVYSTELEYGAPVEEYTPEVAEGRKFDGWQEEIPEFMPAHDVDIHGTTSEIPSGIAAIVAELGNDVDIYNLQGRLLIKNADAKRVSQLPAGIYIINGKKYLKK